MGLVSVFGNDVDLFYEKLLDGESGITLIDRFDASKFPTRFGGQIRGFKSDGYIDGKNDRRLDDCLRYCIVAGKKALESADLGGDKLDKIDKIRAGVLVGTGMGGLTVFSDGVKALIEKGHRKRFCAETTTEINLLAENWKYILGGLICQEVIDQTWSQHVSTGRTSGSEE